MKPFASEIARAALASCFLSVAPLGSAFAEGESVIVSASETDRLVELDGRKAVVHGNVESTGKSPGGTNFVNFRGSEFSLVTFRSDLDQFPEGEPSELYDGRRLVVEGVVAIYQGKPQIKLTSPAQVRFLGEDEEFPPKAVAESAAAVAAGEGDAEGAASAEVAAASGEAGDAEADAPEKRQPPVDPSLYFR